MGDDDCFVHNVSTRSRVEQSDCVLSDTLHLLTDTSRHVFMGIFVVISGIALVGNCAAIYSITKRKYRFVQKTCIVSLALSDILSTLVIATNNLETFSHELFVWTLGSFLCPFIPMCQMVGFIASSLALMFIAMDRYRNVVHALSNRWNFSPKCCIVCVLVLWSFTFAISYPMYDFFTQVNVTLIFMTPTSYRLENAFMCICLDKENFRDYYLAMVVTFFLPIVAVFSWFYYNIASLVWKHRKPVSMSKQDPSETSSANSDNHKDRAVPRDLRVERKIRTFKIIVMLTVVFIACRLPYFTIYILKLSLDAEYGLWTWYLNYAFVALHIVNCCLNPLLYTFLNQTLSAWVRVKRAVKDFVWEVCCFCFSSTEFEAFERENPFVVNYKTRNSKVKFEEDVQQTGAKY